MTIAALAQVTVRLRFISSVYVLSMRDPFTVAKAVSTAAVLSGERLMLGVGVGWMAEEFALTGQRFDARGRRSDESRAATTVGSGCTTHCPRRSSTSSACAVSAARRAAWRAE